mmetsp:Transcript_49486/g.141873  ORF Transcript_49486/g.141873 Transcript_49486/m.141873 type:complete len:384 (-) Transcript_49486:503-1654(-)
MVAVLLYTMIRTHRTGGRVEDIKATCSHLGPFALGCFRLLGLKGLEDKLFQRINDGQHARKLRPQLHGRELVIRSAGLDDLRLFFDRKVFPTASWVDVFLIQLQNLVVRDGSWVAEVVDASLPTQGEFDRIWKKFWKHRHAVGDVHHSVVVCNLVDEVALVPRYVGIDRHADAKSAHIVEGSQHIFHIALCLRIIRSCKVGPVLLNERFRRIGCRDQVFVPGRVDGVFLVVVKDAARGEVGHMHAVALAHIRERQSAKHIHADRLHPVGLAPIHVGSPSQPCSVEHMCATAPNDLLLQGLAVLEAGSRILEAEALFLQHFTKHASDPTSAAKNEEVNRLLFFLGRAVLLLAFSRSALLTLRRRNIVGHGVRPRGERMGDQDRR